LLKRRGFSGGLFAVSVLDPHDLLGHNLSCPYDVTHAVMSWGRQNS